MVDVKSFERTDKTGKIIETSLSVLKKENSKFQLYRINMYNSTMRAEVNGKSHMLFIDELKTIANLMSNKSTYQQLNSKIREACLKLVNNTISHLNNPSTTDIISTVNKSRQKELRLKKWEEELKQQSASNSQNSSENAKLQAYIMKLEAKIKELENSNRILLNKRAGNVDSTPTNVANRDLPIPDMLKRHTEHIVEGFPMHFETQHLQSKIQSMENIYNLNRRVTDLEFNSLKQRLDAIELSKQHWPSPQSTGNHQYHGYQNFIPGQHMNAYQCHIPNPHVNGYQNHKPAPQANGYQNHVPGLQVNGYQNHIPNLNSNGYKNYMHVTGPHGNGCHNHKPSSNADTGSYSYKIHNPQAYGYHNLKPDMHMGIGQLTHNVSINESHQRGQTKGEHATYLTTIVRPILGIYHHPVT
ncbi:unnamed protein product [Mytilus edulis]|uniref:Uncharacterized protein n=1 Tax=Mytilus edulis TaxID=6550 RepID=A0A8S3TL80_MYTED|nr:unnamed protein product [Mytilus edulis]